MLACPDNMWLMASRKSRAVAKDCVFFYHLPCFWVIINFADISTIKQILEKRNGVPAEWVWRSYLNDLPFRFLSRSSWFRGGMSLRTQTTTEAVKAHCVSIWMMKGQKLLAAAERVISFRLALICFVRCHPFTSDHNGSMEQNAVQCSMTNKESVTLEEGKK